MIKINLAPQAVVSASSVSFGDVEGFVTDDELRKEGLKRILVMLLFPTALYLYEMQSLPSKSAALNAKRQTLNELRAYNASSSASVAEIKKFKEEEAKMEARISALDKISKDRQREVRVLDLIQTILPEKAWLVRLEIKSDRILIEGLALSDYEVSSFMDALTKSVYLLDVNLISSREEVVDGSNLKRFDISCLLERPKRNE